MKKLLLLTLAVLLLVGVFIAFPSAPSSLSEDLLPQNQTASTAPVPEITIEEKVGQLFMIGHWADGEVASTTALITDLQLGGVIVMSAPRRAEEIMTWTSAWQEVAKHPLLVGIDQEGGAVTRLKGPGFIQTSQREITSADQAYEVGKIRGAELSDLGINMNFSPVLDSANDPLSFMYDRVFADRTKSASFAVAMIRGLGENKVLGVVKHFPGHDDTVDDSHYTLPVVPIREDALLSFTAPFNEIIRNEPPVALMSAHVLFPELDDKPASLSEFFLEEYLRGTLGYQGLIITDDMSMDAIDTTWSTAEASVLALAAGADIILLAAEPIEVADAVAAVIAAVENGELPKESINESYERVLDLKETLSTNPN